MKRFHIVSTHTKMHGREFPLNSIYGEIECTFTHTQTRHIVHKNKQISASTVTTKATHKVLYNVLNTTPRFSSGHIYYELYIYMPGACAWQYTRNYHAQFEPIYSMIYDTINKHKIKLRPIVADVHGHIPGQPNEKKAQVDFDQRARMGYALSSGSDFMNDTNVTPRTGVVSTGFQEKPRNNRKPYTHSTKEFTEVQKIMTQNLRQYNKYWKEA